MGNEIALRDDAALAEKVIKNYAEGEMGFNFCKCLSVSRCVDDQIDTYQCGVLSGVLGLGMEGEVTPQERQELEDVGFSKTFIRTLAGEDGKKALHARLRWFQDRADKYSDYAKYLARFDRADLMMLMQLGGPFTQEYAIRALQHKGYIASDTQVLTHALTDEHDLVRREAARQLRIMKPKDKAAVQPLAKALTDIDRNVRLDAARALGTMGPKAEAAVQPLAKALTKARIGKDGEMITVAMWALGEIGPKAKDAVPALLGVIECFAEPCYLHPRYSMVLRSIYPNAEDAAHAFAEAAMTHTDPHVRAGAMWAMKEIAPDAAPILLKKLLNKMAELENKVDELKNTLKNTNMRLHRAKKTSHTAINSLVEGLGSKGEAVRDYAVHTLVGIPAATPYLREALNHENPIVRKFARRALNMIMLRQEGIKELDGAINGT